MPFSKSKSNTRNKLAGAGWGAIAGVCTIDSAFCAVSGNALGSVFSGGLAVVTGGLAHQSFTADEIDATVDQALNQEPAK